jgi:hypothetical protein
MTNAERLEYVRSAAFTYVTNGWGVVPGSVWDGRRYTLGHCPTVTAGLVPAMVSERTLRLAHEVWSWWSIAPYSVLARAGEDFDVIDAPAKLVQAALRAGNSAAWSCPIILTADRARLLVGPTAGKTSKLVALPPTLVEGEASRWLITPREVDYRLGQAATLETALAAQR